MSDPGAVTRILSTLAQGNERDADELLKIVYDQLRKLATARLNQEQSGQTLQPTALVHEAYLRLVDQQHQQHWDSRGHFFAAAAEAMRRILIENARRKAALKRGGDQNRIAITAVHAVAEARNEDLLALDEAVTEFERIEPHKAELVKLRFFAGIEEAEAAEVLGISRATAARWWAFSKAWLYERISGDS